MDWPIFVSGLCRCGSSLTMQMLRAAGIPCFGEYPSFEPNEVYFGPERASFALAQRAALKILDPFHDEWPAKFDARIIWLDRNRTEQAKSQVKMVRTFNDVDIPGQAWRAIAKQLRADRFAACDRFWSHCTSDPLFIQFEDLLREPQREAKRICDFLGIADESPRMAGEVIARPSKCQPGMHIEMLLVEYAKQEATL